MDRRQKCRQVSALVSLLGLVSSAYSQSDSDLLLRLRVTDSENSHYYPAVHCGLEDNCPPVNSWFRHHARVREVIRGRYSERRIEFANLQQANYPRSLTRDWLVLLAPCEETVSDEIAVEYCVKVHALKNDREGRERIRALLNGT